MINIGELKIANNKIDSLEGFSVPEEVDRLVLKGNHILEVPAPAAISDIKVKNVRVLRNAKHDHFVP